MKGQITFFPELFFDEKLKVEEERDFITLMRNKIWVIAIVFLLTSINQAAAGVQISDFFSGNLVESHEVPLSLKAGESATRVILWEKKPQYDYYTAKISIYNDSTLLDNNRINYTKTEEDVSLTTTAEFKMLWTFLLRDKKNYLVRAKIFTHRLYFPAF